MIAGSGGNRDQPTTTGSKGAAGASAIRPQPMMQQDGAAEAGSFAVPPSWQGAGACSATAISMLVAW